MCGIAGAVSADPCEPPQRDLVHAMTEMLRHRGPDDAGYLLAPGAALGMRRLSVIDVAGGAQPVYAEDGRTGVVYNGEIYNHVSLRAELEARGHRFRSHADTEVIVHGYEQWGDEVVRRLRGMFALALWDAPRRRLLLARDRLGKKPLHYACIGNRLLFASELKSLLLVPDLPRDLDLEALDDFLSFGYVLGPRAIFRAVRKLPPAHLLIWENGTAREQRYWQIAITGDDPRPARELVDELRVRLDDAVRIRLMSDVPLGAFLSGGIDSSAVVALMSRHSAAPVKTFSIGFDEAGFDELAHARAVAAHVGADHHELVVRPNMVEDLPRIVRQFDEPFADASAVPTYHVARMARAHVTVALSGDGGDESFAGYERYAHLEHDPLVRYVPAPLRRALPWERATPLGARGHERLWRARLAWPQRYAAGMTVFPPHYRAHLYTHDAYQAVAGRDPLIAYSAFFAGGDSATPSERRTPNGEYADGDLLSPSQAADLQRYLPDDILVKVDRMSMLCSLEARCPLLDHELVEFMARVPAALKLRGHETKWLLRQAVAPLLPASIVHRGKMGFSVPIRTWLRGPLRDLLTDVLLAPEFRRRGFFRPAFVQRLIRWHNTGAGRHEHRLWALLCFELWARSYLDGEGWKPSPAAPAHGDEGRAIALGEP